MDLTEAPTGSSRARVQYRAPALEKGLDILKLLAAEHAPLTLTSICQKLKRSQGEIFRMIQVLEMRGFIQLDVKSGGYVLTDLLFSMAMQQPPTQSLVELSIPAMRSFVAEIGQSCHVALHSRGEIVVVARMESLEQLGFTVRVGYRRSIIKTVSGLILFAYQPDDVREHWLGMIQPRPTRSELAIFMKHADQTLRRGFAQIESSFVKGVTDISAPIIRGDRAAAALTVPYVQTPSARGSPAEVARKLKAVAADISSKLIEGDSEGQAALRLGLSRHTVHEYVTEIYRRFGGRSRAELMA